MTIKSYFGVLFQDELCGVVCTLVCCFQNIGVDVSGIFMTMVGEFMTILCEPFWG